MALIEDMFKGNLLAGLTAGAGAVLLGPTVIERVACVLRPAAKTLIKGSIVLYRETLSELSEMAGDLYAEARAELEQAGDPGGEAAPDVERRRTGAKEHVAAG